MKIEWLGHSSFKLTESTGTSIITDPYDSKGVGTSYPDVTADIVTVSHKHFDHDAIRAVDGAPTVIDVPGVVEINGVNIYGFLSFHDKKRGALRGKNIVYRFRMDGVEICHLGDIGEELSPMLAELIGSVNVLMIPVGGKYTIDAEEAKEYVDMLMPDVVIPMHYKTDGYNGEFADIDEFLDLFPRENVVFVEEDFKEFDRTDFDGEKTTVLVMKKIN